MKNKTIFMLFHETNLLGMYDLNTACKIVNGMREHGPMRFVGKCIFV